MMLTPQDRRRLAAAAAVDERTLRRAYRADHPIRPTTWERIATAARRLRLPPPPPAVAAEAVAVPPGAGDDEAGR